MYEDEPERTGAASHPLLLAKTLLWQKVESNLDESNVRQNCQLQLVLIRC